MSEKALNFRDIHHIHGRMQMKFDEIDKQLLDAAAVDREKVTGAKRPPLRLVR